MLYCAQKLKLLPENATKLYLRGAMGMFIPVLFGDQYQIMPIQMFSSEISTTSADFNRKH